MVLYTIQVYQTQLASTKFSQIQQNSPSSPDSPKFSRFTKTHQIKLKNSRIPLTDAQTMLLFEESEKMVIGHDMVLKSQEKGIEDVDDLKTVDKDFLNQLIDNLKRLCGQINFGGVMIATPFFKFCAKSQMRLEAASNIL